MNLKIMAFVPLMLCAHAQQTDYKNLVNGPSLYSTRFNFSLIQGNITSGGLSTPGSNTLTLRPCPLGVNGSDANHYLRVSGGVGTAESAPITGGTCTSGAASGTIQISTANSHTGSWALGSATGGISEAIWSMTPGVGGTVLLPAGTMSIYAPVKRRTGMPIFVKGSGMQSTIVSVSSDFPLSANGVFDWSPGDAIPVTEGGISNFTIKFIQPDSTSIAAYTHWPAAVYTTGTYHTQWENLTIIAAWDGFNVPGNTNGMFVNNVYASFFHRLFDINGHSFDTVKLENIQSSTVGLTANQGTCYLDPNKVNPVFYVGSIDDLKITNVLVSGPFFADFHAGSDGLYTAGQITNAWIEGNINMSNGIIGMSNVHFSGGGPAQNFITYTGGVLMMDQADISHSGSQTAISLVASHGFSIAPYWPEPMVSITNSRIKHVTADIRGIYATTAGGYTGTFDVMVQNNVFIRPSGGTYANQTILGEAGSGSVRMSITGNRFSDFGASLGGVAIQVDTDTNHVITGNDGGNWNFAMPGYTNLLWAANNNFAGNTHRFHNPMKITSRLSPSTFAPLQTENYIASETGANNAIAGALLDAGGTAIPLAAGVRVTILLAHTLQVGANTFNLNAGGAVNIKSSRNPANNIATAYAVGGILTITYDGTQWVDMSQ